MKSFAINFKGGFAFTNDGNTLVNIINEVAEVEVTKSGSLFGAYVMCCRKYTDQITPNLTRELQPKLPKFEDFQDQLFTDATFFKTYKPIRVFAFIAENVVGIFEGLPQNVVPTVVGCLFDYNNAMIKEFPDFKSAEIFSFNLSNEWLSVRRYSLCHICFKPIINVELYDLVRATLHMFARQMETTWSSAWSSTTNSKWIINRDPCKPARRLL